MSWFNLSDNINLLALIGAAATIVITVIALGAYISSAKGPKSSGKLSDGDWDGIKEYKNPLPLGWAISFLVLCVWAIWYMCAPAGLPFAYPLNAYSQVGEYNEEVQAYNAKFEEKWQNLDDATLVNMGESIFLVQCAQCHGITGNGIDGKAADLTKWGTEAAAVDSVIHGSKGLGYDLGEMAPMLGDLVGSEEEVKLAAAYLVKYVSQTKPVTSADALTRDVEAEAWNVCSSCHGEDGAGMENAAPNLTNYGKTAFVADVLSRGKEGYIGSMPTFNDGRLTDIQKQAVGTYVLSLRR
jgi:cytochrome c oxidase cbb3-type subunit 3